MSPSERLVAYWVDQWREQGHRFGYPDCCIEDFCARPDGYPPRPQRLAGQGTGFIPCPMCAEEVLAGRPLHTLIQDRAEVLPFPLAHRAMRSGA